VDLKEFFAKITGLVGATTFYIISIGMLPGWAYWMWMAIQLGSFGMFLFGILGPLAFVAGLLGLWSLLFGAPLWLLSLVT
jgi:hypothetical protein